MERPGGSEQAAQGELSRRNFLIAAGTAIGTGLLANACTTGPNWPDGPEVAPDILVDGREITGPVDLLREGNWKPLAGAQVTAQGLELSPTGMSFVDKRDGDKKTFVPNPPLNMLGMRLQAAGDFALQAQISSQTPTSFQLYGKLPRRYDDFRVETSRVECETAGNVLTVRVWDGSSQTPMRYSVPFTGSATDRQVQAMRHGDKLVISVNGSAAVDIGGANQLFKDGSIWLGFNSEQGPARVTSLLAQPLDGHKLELVDPMTTRAARPLPGGLQSLVRRRGFLVGAAVAPAPLVSDAQYAQVYLGGEVGLVTIENGLKPQDIQPSRGTFFFNEPDALVNFLLSRGLQVHGGPLLHDDSAPRFVRQLKPDDLTTKDATELIQQQVAAPTGHFNGRVSSWDIWNEFTTGYDNASIEQNVFYTVLKMKAFGVAVQAARDAAPKAKLYLNESGMETNPARANVVLGVAEWLSDNGLAVDGIGMQGHVDQLPRDDIRAAAMNSLAARTAKIGGQLRVSEFDVTASSGVLAQAQEYGNVTGQAVGLANCPSITFWDLQDAYGAGAGLDNAGFHPADSLLYRADWTSKPARQAVAAALRGR